MLSLARQIWTRMGQAGRSMNDACGQYLKHFTRVIYSHNKINYITIDMSSLEQWQNKQSTERDQSHIVLIESIKSLD